MLFSEIINDKNMIINYNIFTCDELVKLKKDMEIFNFEVTCFCPVGGIKYNSFFILTNVLNEQDKIKIKIQGYISKPLPRENIQINVLNKIKKNIQIEIFNELDIPCEFKIYSDLFILFGEKKKIEMMPKQKKLYTFFIKSAHIGEFIGCLIFKFYKYKDTNNENNASFFSDYFFWYRLNIVVQLNEPMKILYLETFIGQEITKDIIIKK